MSKKYAGATRSARTQLAKPNYAGSSSQDARNLLEQIVEQGSNLEEATYSASGFVISTEMQEEAKGILQKSFRNFADHSQRLAEGLAEFNKKREEVRGEINRGARRTSGHIV